VGNTTCERRTRRVIGLDEFPEGDALSFIILYHAEITHSLPELPRDGGHNIECS
jgi:hypothetical protein